MNIVISGASGFIGTHLCNYLSKFPEYKVYALTRSGIIDGPTIAVRRLKFDFTIHNPTEILPHKSDIVIHLAQSSVPSPVFPKDGQDVFDVNIKSTLKLLEYACKSEANHFIYFSSGAVYGKSHAVVNENSTLKLNDFYASSKYISELLVNDYSEFFKTTIFRLFFPYGESQQSFRLIPRLIAKVKNREHIRLEGTQGLYINPIHVQDVLNFILKTIQLQKAGLYNLAGPEILSIKMIAEKIGSYLKINPIFETSDAASDEYLAGDIANLVTSLQHSPDKLFSDMLCEMTR